MLPRPTLDVQWIPAGIADPLPEMRWFDRVVYEENLITTWQGLVAKYHQYEPRPFRGIDPHTLMRDDTPAGYRVFREAAINLLTHQDYADHTRKAFEFRLPIKTESKTTQVTGQVSGEVTREVAGEVTGEVRRLLTCLRGEMTRRELQNALQLRGEENFRQKYLVPALAGGFVEMTVPDKPQSRLQRYRLTSKGRQWIEAHQPGRKP
jgi:hypothetical protein